MDEETKKTDLLLLLLYAKGSSGKINEPIIGITRLMKLLFLLKEEGKVDDAFSFEPYKMGPFSSEVYPELNFLQNFPTPENSFLKIKPGEDNGTISPEQIKLIDDIGDINSSEDEPLTNSEINTEFSLSDLGRRVAEKIWNQANENQRTTIETVKTKYGNLTLRDLLRYVYKNYPDMTINSEIKSQLQ